MAERSEYLHDVFVSHSQADREWVDEWLLPRLEQAGLRAAVDYRDFVVGMPRIESIERAVENSRRTIVVLTPDWLDSEWNAFEALLLRTMDPAARRRKLLPVLLKPCAPPDLIDSLEKADLTIERHWEKQIKRLTRDIEDVIPVSPPWKERGVRDFTQWKRWVRRYRRELRRGVAAIFAVWLIASVALRSPPFQPRRGWQALGTLPVGGTWCLSRAGDVLLVSTTTDFVGCNALDTGLWRSADQGATWEAIPAPLEFLHPSLGCVLAAITDFAHAPTDLRRIYATTTHVGLLRSDDGGENWFRIEADVLPKNLQRVVIVPHNPDHVFVAADEVGLYRSFDGGSNWERLDGAHTCAGGTEGQTGLPEMLDVGAMLAAADRLYVGTYSRLTLYPGPADGLYVSHDEGNCWHMLHDAEGRYKYLALADVPGTRDLLALTLDSAAQWGSADIHLWHLQGTQGQAKTLWESRYPAVTVHVETGAPPTWYVATDVGGVSRGSLGKAGWERLPLLTRCVLPPSCFTDLAPDFDPGPPLLLAGDRVFRLGTVPWHRRLWP